MSLPQIVIKNPQATIVIFLFLLIAGIRAFMNIPQYEDPQVQAPGSVVMAIYPGASPSDLENLVVDPIEDALYELDGVKTLESDIQNGLAIIKIEFDFNEDAQEKVDEVQGKVNGIKDQMPSGLQELTVKELSTSDVSIYEILMVGDGLSYRTLKDEAEKIQDTLQDIDGLKAVNIEAFAEQQVRIALDPMRMQATGVTLDNIENAIQSSNSNVPSGDLKIGNRQFNVQTSGFYKDLNEIRRTVVKSSNGENVSLEDVSDVDFCYADEQYLARVNGESGIMISIQQNENVNVHDISAKVRSRIDHLKFDHAIKLVYVFDQSEQVKENVWVFLSNLIQGILLVGLIIWFILGGRPALVVMASIPLSVVIGLIVVDESNFGLQQISISGLVIALGLLVDNSIAITENIERYLDMGMSRLEASVKGASTLGAALISGTLTTCLAFIPIITMPDKTGEFILSMPVTVIATLAASLLIAFTLTPLVASKMFKEGKHRSATFLAKKLQHFAENRYVRIQEWIFSHQKTSILTISILFLLTLVLFKTSIKTSFFPKAQKPQFRITVNMPGGSNLLATNRVTHKVEAVLDTIDDVKYYVANVGHGNPRIFYNVGSTNFKANFAEIYVKLKSYDETAFYALIDELRRTYDTFDEARIDVKEYTQGTSDKAPLQINIYGQDLDQLKVLSRKVEDIVRKQEGIINLSNESGISSIDLKVDIFREKAAMLGVPISNIDKAVRTYIGGRTLSTFHDNESEEYDIVLRYGINEASRFTYEDFEQIQVSSMSGQSIPLLNLAHISFSPGETKIDHKMGKRCASIQGDLAEGYNLGETVKTLKIAFASLDWQGYSYEFGGDLKAQKESFSGLTTAAIFAMVLCFLVLIIQFRSFLQPIIVFTALPFGIIGAILFLFIFNSTFSFMAFIGFISLIGIAINDSIVLTEFANQELKEGKTVKEAAIDGGKIRFVPILTTTLTTILGMLPLTLFGGSFWMPMGLVVIGGMISSTGLILLILPLIYFKTTRRIDKSN